MRHLKVFFAAGVMWLFSLSSASAQTVYQVTPIDTGAASQWLTGGSGFQIGALYWIFQSSNFSGNDAAKANELEGLLNSDPMGLATVTSTGSGPADFTRTLSDNGGTSAGADITSYGENAHSGTASGTFSVNNANYVGVKDGVSGFLVALLTSSYTGTVNFNMAYTLLNGSPIRNISHAFSGSSDNNFPPSEVPVPAAIWLFGSALLGMVGISRRGALSAKA